MRDQRAMVQERQVSSCRAGRLCVLSARLLRGHGFDHRNLEAGMGRPHESFRRQWQLAEVRIITIRDNDIGWLQTTAAKDAIFLA